MSVQAIAWALEDAPDVPSELVAVLVGLANHADRDGRHAFPSLATLAKYSRKSSRQVRRDLRDLQTRGLIRPGDERLVLHLNAGQRPNVYDLAMNLTRDTDVPSTPDVDVPPTPDTGVPPADVPPADVPRDTDVRTPRTPTSAKPSLNRKTSTSVSTEGDSSAREQARDAADPDRTHEPAVPITRPGRPLTAEQRAELDRMGAEAQAAVAAARAEATAADAGAIASCQLCDEHGLLPSRVRCLHPRQRPAPGSGRAAFAAARAELAARTQPCDSCSRSASACRDSRAGRCCPACTHRPVDEQADTSAASTPDPCPTCERTNGHQPGCPDDPATPCPWPTCSLPFGHDQHEHDDDVVDAVIHEADCPGGDCQCADDPEPDDEAGDVGAFGPDDPPF